MRQSQNEQLEKFFTQSSLIEKASIVLHERVGLKKAEPVKFMDKYTIRTDRDGAAVYDGDKLIASIGRLNDLVVEPTYRGQHIAENLIVEWYTKNRWFYPDRAAVRTKNGQNAYTRAWARIRPSLTITND